MKKFIFCIFIICIFFTHVTAQEEGENSPNKGIDGAVVFQPVRQGDTFMKIGLSLGVPLFNTSNTKFAINPHIYPGGAINIGVSYYVLNGFSLGGSLSFHFYPTIAKNLYFAVPITFDMAYTFAKGKWRFPLGGGVGAAFQSYNGNGGRYFGMLFKFDAGVYYQYSPEWSFGGDVSWNVLPQWYKDTSHNRTGNILGISFAARYHF